MGELSGLISKLLRSQSRSILVLDHEIGKTLERVRMGRNGEPR